MNGRRAFERARWTIGVAVITLAAMAASATAPDAAQFRVRLTDLGTLGGDSSEAAGLNNAGHVVGSSSLAGGAVHGFIYRDGVMTDLGTLPGGTHSHATGINDQGQVVGYAGINEFGPQFKEFVQGFLWQDGTMESLDSLYCPCTFNQRYGTSAGFAINAAGQVVGDSGTVRGESIRHAFVWQAGLMQDMGGGAGSFSVSFAYAINTLGQVAGSLDDHAVLWQDAEATDLGTLPGHTGSVARALNGAGQVVGESSDDVSGQSRAFLWDSGMMHDLGTLPGDTASQANAVSGAGDVVGWSGAADGSASRAVLWRRGAIHDLNRFVADGSGWVLTSATAVNDRGQIAGVGLHNGQRRAFLLSVRLVKPAKGPGIP
jgi:probable HAF family extracellular repeat protein